MRVVVAEDLFLLRDGLVRLLEAHGFEITEAVGTGPALHRALLTHRPDVAIVDVRLPPSFTDEGLQAALAARREVPGLPVLADRGLADAVRALVLDTPLPIELDIDLPGPTDAGGQASTIEMPVGAAVYFAVAEALANAVRHSGARTVRIHLSHAAGTLRAQVTDDGAGGADPAQGTGLAGVERRLATFDGILAVSSPPGGPTIIAIEVPCALSSAKTSSC